VLNMSQLLNECISNVLNHKKWKAFEVIGMSVA
jgi:hypothetical protein